MGDDPVDPEELRFTREDAECLTKTCTILERMEGEQIRQFKEIKEVIERVETSTIERSETLEKVTGGRYDALSGRLEQYITATKAQRDICAVKFTKIEEEGPLTPSPAIVKRVEAVESDVKDLTKFKDQATIVVTIAGIIMGVLFTIRDNLVSLATGHGWGLLTQLISYWRK